MFRSPFLCPNDGGHYKRTSPRRASLMYFAMSMICLLQGSSSFTCTFSTRLQSHHHRRPCASNTDASVSSARTMPFVVQTLENTAPRRRFSQNHIDMGPFYQNHYNHTIFLCDCRRLLFILTIFGLQPALPPFAGASVNHPTVSLPTTELVATNSVTKNEWTLGNGHVQLPDPLRLGNMILYDPELLGSGGGGAVFAMSQISNDAKTSSARKRIAVKVSWDASTPSVVNECRILQHLQRYQVSGVEQCLEQKSYAEIIQNENTGTTIMRSPRVVLALVPVMEDSVTNSIADLPTLALQSRATQQVVRTLVQMLAANVVTTDVQPLISQTTGNVLFIDMTEAQILSNEPLSILQLSLCSSFCAEMVSLIPETMYQVASQILQEELERLDNDGGKNHPFLLQVRSIVNDQVPFLSPHASKLLAGWWCTKWRVNTVPSPLLSYKLPI